MADNEFEDSVMKAGIHPAYEQVKVICSCGEAFTTQSTALRELHLDVCSKCHPFYTGKQKVMDTAGRVDRFKKKYSVMDRAKASKEEAAPK